MESEKLFETGELVYCLYGDLYYEAKILQVIEKDESNPSQRFKIHYQGILTLCCLNVHILTIRMEFKMG
jgi:hypothetical protein